ncbi:MAG: hypothetical protein PHS97_01375 [Oscillospiraceae bacterium]|nr:hypothetical protein [Oscillospiraceae bacterium]
MQLGLTIPLQRYLKLKNLPYGEPLDRQYCWDLHVITLQGRPSLLAVHCATRYTVTLFDVTIFQWGALQDTFLQGLRQSFTAVSISTETTERYLLRAGKTELTKTHGRREVAFLNRAWDDVAALDYTLDAAAQAQPLLDCAVNQKLSRCAGTDGLGQAEQRLIRSLERTSQ